MTEYVFRPLRAGVRARLYSGRYALNRGDKPRTVALGTPDKLVARKRLRDLIVTAQREAEGLITPAPLREAAADTLTALLAEFTADLDALGRTPQHVHDTNSPEVVGDVEDQRRRRAAFIAAIAIRSLFERQKGRR